MATVTTFLERQSEFQTVLGRMHYAYNKLDFSATGVSSADVVQALKIPANSLVTEVSVTVRTAEGGTCTATVGDGAGASSWDAATNLNATADTVTSSVKGTDAYAVGKFYSSADTIDLTMNNAAATAVINVAATYMVFDS